MRKRFAVPLAALLTLVAALTLSALRLPSRQLPVAPSPTRAVDGGVVARHLAESIRFPTISFSDDPAQLQTAAFEAFHGWLAQSYPLLHRTLVQERVGEQSLLYTWQGSDARLEPILLLAHQDVVPADNAERWSRPPFEGRIEDGFVWGRGAIDDKGSLVAICEAVERLLADGYTPRRTVLLAFGHDEEVGGARGAGEIAKLLASRGVHALLAIDEGSAVVHDLLPGVDRLVALVGISEKGSATLEVVARAEGGHSSTPPRQSASGILAGAIGRLEANPLEVRFKYPARESSPVSPIDGPAFRLVQRTIGEVFSGAITVPFLTVGGTDCRHYEGVTQGLYRLMPFPFGPADLKLPHGIDERVAVASLPDAVRFYARLIENASAN